MYFSRSSRSRDTAIWHCSFLNFENIQPILREKRLRNLSIFDKNWFCLLPEKIKRTSHHHFQLTTLYNRGNRMATSLNYTFRPHVSCSTNFQLKCHWSQTSQGREVRGEGGREQREKLNESERKTEKLETESGKVSVSSQIIDLQYIYFFFKKCRYRNYCRFIKKGNPTFFLVCISNSRYRGRHSFDLIFPPIVKTRRW